LWAWGYNYNSQLGNGSNSQSITPIQIGTDTWKTVSSGFSHSLGIKSGNSIFSWGINYYGELGDPANQNRNIPTKIFNELLIQVNQIPTATISGGGVVCSTQPLPNVEVNFTGRSPWTFTYNHDNVDSTITTSLNPYIINGATEGNYVINSCSNMFCSGSTSGNIDVVVTPASYFYLDFDGDGFGNSIDSILSCVQPVGYSINNSDCNDTVFSVHELKQFYIDSDGDGFGSTAAILLCSLNPFLGYSLNNLDCNDSVFAINPLAFDIPLNGIDEDCNSIVDDTTSALTLNLNLFIQGFYIGSGTMNSVLLNAGVGADPLECDTIIVELHDQFDPTVMSYSTSAILYTNGESSMQFPPSAFGSSYYIVIRHRNSIETWSKFPVMFSGNPVTYNFTTP
jgi:hypothetical protein